MHWYVCACKVHALGLRNFVVNVHEAAQLENSF